MHNRFNLNYSVERFKQSPLVLSPSPGILQAWILRLAALARMTGGPHFALRLQPLPPVFHANSAVTLIVMPAPKPASLRLPYP